MELWTQWTILGEIMKRYWSGKLKNGNSVCEKTHEWKDVKKDLVSLAMVLEDKDLKIDLPSGLEYIQAKTASADLSGGNIQIESRYIGFINCGKKTIIRVEESTGNISVEVIQAL